MAQQYYEVLDDYEEKKRELGIIIGIRIGTGINKHAQRRISINISIGI